MQLIISQIFLQRVDNDLRLLGQRDSSSLPLDMFQLLQHCITELEILRLLVVQELVPFHTPRVLLQESLQFLHEDLKQQNSI